MFPLALLVLVTVPLYWTLLPRAARRPAFALIAIGVLASYAPLSVLAVGALSLVVHLLLAASPLAAGALALAFLLVHKYTGLWSALGVPAAILGAEVAVPGVVRLLGVSYATFRLIHLAIEVGRGKVQRGSLAGTLEYVLFPPAFLSGPIEREPDFHGRLALEELTLDHAFWSVRRILTGLAKKVLLVTPLAAAVAPAFAPLAQPSALEAWLALFGYALVIYLDFSAYCDIALGVARLYGFVLSENFDWPYLAPSITAFWQRWHITLSNWLRDYIFLPLSVVLGRAPYLRDAPVATGSVCAIVTMLACGVWHGDTWAFVVWGLGHGCASALHQAWRQHVIAMLPARRRKDLMNNATYRVASTLLTFLFVSLWWPLFRLDVAGTVHFWRRLVAL